VKDFLPVFYYLTRRLYVYLPVLGLFVYLFVSMITQKVAGTFG